MTHLGEIKHFGAASAVRPNLPALTGVRYIAALHVVLTHTGLAIHWPGWTSLILDRGYVGVSLFFTLSGFILAYTYLDESGRQMRGDKAGFWIARFARVYPLYIVGLVIGIPSLIHTVGTGLVSVPVAIQAVILAPLMLQAWSTTAALTWNSPAWSLSAEAFFYALFPFIISPMARTRSRWLLPLMLGFWALSLTVAAVQSAFASDLAWQEFVIHVPASRVIEFAIGILLGVAFVKYQWRLPSWCAGASMFAIVATLALVPADMPRSIISNALLEPLFVVLLLSLASGQSLASRALSTRGAVLLGEVSFAVYLLHIPLYRNFFYVTERLLPGFGGSPLGLLLFIIMVTAASVVAYQHIEKPSRKFIRGWFSKRQNQDRDL